MSVIEEAAFRAWCDYGKLSPDSDHARIRWLEINLRDKKEWKSEARAVLSYAATIAREDAFDNDTAGRAYSLGAASALMKLAAKLTEES